MINLKKKVPKFKGTITMGLFLPEDELEWKNHIIEMEGKEVEVVCKKFRAYKERSGEQNRYYWGVVVKILSEELGYTDEEIHEILKYQFLSEIREINRERMTLQGTEKYKKLISVPLTTANLSTLDFEDFLTKVRVWASRELSIFIPLPNEVPFEY